MEQLTEEERKELNREFAFKVVIRALLSTKSIPLDEMKYMVKHILTENEVDIIAFSAKLTQQEILKRNLTEGNDANINLDKIQDILYMTPKQLEICKGEILLGI